MTTESLVWGPGQQYSAVVFTLSIKLSYDKELLLAKSDPPLSVTCGQMSVSAIRCADNKTNSPVLIFQPVYMPIRSK